MKQIAHLRKEIGKYRDRNNHPPVVRISEKFWENNHHGIAELSNEGIDIQVDEELAGKAENISIL
jgi:hypothetical protein